MADALVFNVSVAFAIVTGTAAGLLSLLTWRVFRQSPFGRVVFALTLMLFVFIVYHVLLIASQSEPLYAKVLFSATYAALVAFIWVAVRAQHQLVAAAEGAGSVAALDALAGLDPFSLYNGVLGLVAGAGLLYFLYLGSVVVGYRRFVLVTTAGLVVFAVVGPVFELFLPAYVHGVAALLVVLGLYDPVRNDLRTDQWAALLLEDPARVRGPADWMVPMDDRILSLFHAADLVLTPAIIGYDLEHSRESVNRRLTRLEAAGLVERVERGKYRMTDAGQRYLDGEAHAAMLAADVEPGGLCRRRVRRRDGPGRQAGLSARPERRRVGGGWVASAGGRSRSAPTRTSTGQGAGASTEPGAEPLRPDPRVPPGVTGVVVAEAVRRTYGETVALDGVSLSVAEGEVFALIGPNGAGKTTLVRALTGTTRPDSGSARLLGGPHGEADRSRLGLLPQDFDPPGRLTPSELVRYYAGLYDEARDPAAVLADVGMADAGGTWYENLSGGERRRVAVATALVNDPDVLFLDEPTTGVDPAGRRALWDLVADLAGGGTTVLLTTHYMAEAERLGDRVGLLADGRLVAVGPPADLVAEHGGEPRLVVDADADTAALDGSGYDVAATDGGLVLRGVPAEAVGDAVATLDDRGVAYDGLTWRAPDLEDVYLRLTGERLEDGGRRAEARAAVAARGGDGP